MHVSLNTQANMKTSKAGLHVGFGQLDSSCSRQSTQLTSPPADLAEALQGGMHLLKHLPLEAEGEG